MKREITLEGTVMINLARFPFNTNPLFTCLLALVLCSICSILQLYPNYHAMVRRAPCCSFDPQFHASAA